MIRRAGRTLLPFTVIATLLLTAAIQALGGVRAQAATPGCATTGRYLVCATNPETAEAGRDYAVIDEIRRQILASKPGGAIRIAMYKMTIHRIAHDLVDARKRGVDVKAVLGTNDHHPDRNEAVIRILRAGGVPVTVCVDSCLPNRNGDRRGAMHNKFIIISGGGTKTVTQTSSNLTGSQAGWHQNLLSIRGDEAMYRHYLGYWNRLAAKSWTVGGDTWANADRARPGDHDRSVAYVFPVVSGDPLKAILDDVTDCRTGADRIRVSHGVTQRTAVRDRLIELHNAGCDVKVAAATAADEKFMQARVPGLGRLDPDKVKRHRGTHNKFVVIDAKYRGQWRELVVTGSHNMNYNGLKNANDVMIRLVHTGVAEEYFTAFRLVYR